MGKKKTKKANDLKKIFIFLFKNLFFEKSSLEGKRKMNCFEASGVEGKGE
jgi:hypothetical protein